MKKVSLLMAAFALVLGFSQCSKKPVMPSYSGPVGDRIIQHVDMSASYGSGDNNSKLEIGTGSAANLLSLTWSEDESDRINVFQMINKEEKSITTDESGLPIYNISEDGQSAEFKGDIVADPNKELIFRSGNKPTPENFKGQIGTLDYIKSNLLCVEGTSKYEESGIYNVVNMTLPYAILKLDLSYFAPSSSKEEVTVDISVKGEETPIATVTGVTKESKAMYVALPAEEKQNSESLTEKTYVFSCGDKKVEKPFKIGYGAFFTAGGTGGAEVITPKFTVAAGKTVEFAPGNLYWDGSKFKFEANQWSFASTWDASYVSHFKWSDAANAVTGNTNYNGDLFCASNFTVDGDSHTWRTLSKGEWEYLLNTSGSSGRTDASRFAKAKVNNVCGLLIFPDGYKGTTSGDGIATLNAKAAAYPTDNILPNTWKSMESAGVVFLPAAGVRTSTSVTNVGKGYYWSSTPEGDGCAYYMQFLPDNVNTIYALRDKGRLVRLVR